MPGLSVGIMSAAQGAYSTSQFLLDITQGARIASSAYTRPLRPRCRRFAAGAGAVVAGWPAARRRAEDAPQLLRPGLLASRIPGGAAYAGIAGTDDADAVAAAGLHGHVAGLSLGTAPTLLARAAALSRGRRLVVVDLPGGAPGYSDLRALSAGRSPQQLVIVVQRVPSSSGHALLWVAAAGLPGGGGRELSSADDQPARADRLRRPGSHDSRSSRPQADPRRHARRPDPHRRLPALRRACAACTRRLGVIGRQAPEGAWIPAARVGAPAARIGSPSASARAWAMRIGRAGGAVGARRRAGPGRARAGRGGGVRDDRARLHAAGRAHRRAAPVAARAPGPGDRGDPRHRHRRPGAHAAVDALAARPRPDTGGALLRHRQRAEVGPRRARARGRCGRAVSDRDGGQTRERDRRRARDHDARRGSRCSPWSRARPASAQGSAE